MSSSLSPFLKMRGLCLAEAVQEEVSIWASSAWVQLFCLTLPDSDLDIITYSGTPPPTPCGLEASRDAPFTVCCWLHWRRHSCFWDPVILSPGGSPPQIPLFTLTKLGKLTQGDAAAQVHSSNSALQRLRFCNPRTPLPGLWLWNHRFAGQPNPPHLLQGNLLSQLMGVAWDLSASLGVVSWSQSVPEYAFTWGWNALTLWHLTFTLLLLSFQNTLCHVKAQQEGTHRSWHLNM